MTLARRNASPVASGIAGAGSLPGVQAAVAGSSPAQFRPSDFDCVGAPAAVTEQETRKKATPGEATARHGWSRCKPGAQSPICPELTAYITTLLAVVGAIAWAHVFSMDLKLANQLINFHPRVMFCGAVGNKPEKLCAISHRE